MKKVVVLDTNVIISAALSPGKNASKIIDLIESDEGIDAYYSLPIMDEYEEVLSRPHMKISDETRELIVNTIKKRGTLIHPAASTILLHDEDDRIFYDAAKASDAILITGNTKHFPSEPFIMNPSDFLRIHITGV
jgi:putative PIN family toxin of toxin-antitoxin system